MDPLLAAALTALDVADEPHPLTAHHTHPWRAGRWKIKTTTEPATATLLLHEVYAVRLLHIRGLHAADRRYGRVGDGVWTAVEFLPGVDLWHWCARGRLPTRRRPHRLPCPAHSTCPRGTSRCPSRAKNAPAAANPTANASSLLRPALGPPDPPAPPPPRRPASRRGL